MDAAARFSGPHATQSWACLSYARTAANMCAAREFNPPDRVTVTTAASNSATERDTSHSFLPSFIEGSDTLFVGQGSDIAYTDFSQLKGQAIHVSADLAAGQEAGASACPGAAPPVSAPGPVTG